MGICIVCGKPTRQEWYKYCDEHFKSRRSPSKSRRSSLPANYLARGYFDERGNLRAELITTYAKEIAHALDRSRMTSASLRKFFGKVKSAQRRLDSSNDFHAIVPDVLALEPYVNNAVTRGVVPPLFREFIERNLAIATKDKKSFREGFTKHFEYVIAFFPKK